MPRIVFCAFLGILSLTIACTGSRDGNDSGCIAGASQGTLSSDRSQWPDELATIVDVYTAAAGTWSVVVDCPPEKPVSAQFDFQPCESSDMELFAMDACTMDSWQARCTNAQASFSGWSGRTFDNSEAFSQIWSHDVGWIYTIYVGNPNTDFRMIGYADGSLKGFVYGDANHPTNSCTLTFQR
ncbi:MAG: hypothetical protein GXP62_01380 [Oligoflexia bacterium]|nr:hypothetical protein [Oligoflexia bacterium]